MRRRYTPPSLLLSLQGPHILANEEQAKMKYGENFTFSEHGNLEACLKSCNRDGEA